MRFSILFITLLVITTCLSWNPPQQVQDTPEVAAAKAAHLAALAKAKEKTREKAKYGKDGSWKKDKNLLKGEDNKEEWKKSWEDDRAWNAEGDPESQSDDDGSWKGDESWKNYDDGSWEEDKNTTENPKPEVRWDGQGRWTGPVALPPGYDESGAPLPVEDTPEVAAAKAKHLLLYAKAVSRGQVEPLQPSLATVNQQLSAGQQARQPPNNAIFTAPAKPKVRQPLGRSAPPPHQPAPVWETNDEVQDTPEVAAAKAAHYAAHSRRRNAST